MEVNEFESLDAEYQQSTTSDTNEATYSLLERYWFQKLKEYFLYLISTSEDRPLYIDIYMGLSEARAGSVLQLSHHLNPSAGAKTEFSKLLNIEIMHVAARFSLKTFRADLAAGLLFNQRDNNYLEDLYHQNSSFR